MILAEDLHIDFNHGFPIFNQIMVYGTSDMKFLFAVPILAFYQSFIRSNFLTKFTDFKGRSNICIES
jgi:hypothetical protein